MAFLQTDFPPSTAPVVVRTVAVAEPRKAAPVKPVPRALWQRIGLARIAAVAIAAAAIVLPGYLVFRSAESLALGILASDMSFLIAVAVGSSFSRR